MTTLLDANPVLQGMYRDGRVERPDGTTMELHSRLTPTHAEALYQLVLAERPTHVVEVGMAFGASTLAILTALAELGGDRRLVSLDPMQHSLWEGVGVHSVQRAGFADLHELREAPDYLGLPDLVREGFEAGFAYIDGWHTFDYTLLDAFYADRLLLPGGVMGFNDCDMPAVTRVLRFLTSHRRYEPVDAGLEPAYAVPPGRLARAAWAIGRRAPLGARPNVVQRAVGLRADDQYLRKLETWEPEWDFYADF